MRYYVIHIKESGKELIRRSHDTLKAAVTQANKIWNSLPLFNQLNSEIEIRGYEEGYGSAYTTFIW